ncbi:DDE_3 domain-containing protein [Trichonephila clavipes]|nr:DDE_3 domain-containing protein [Trichonephila clavipes]
MPKKKEIGVQETKQRYDRDCLLPIVKHGWESVTIWAVVSWYFAGPIVNLKGRIPGEKYREISADQIHPMIQTLFPAKGGIFQDEIAPVHAAGLVQLWFDEHQNEVKHQPRTSQSTESKIIKPLWPILERSVRNQYPPMKGAVSSLVVRTSDSRPEGLGSMPEATKYPTNSHEIRARLISGSEVFWAESQEQKTGEYFPFRSNCGGGNRWCRHLSSLREFQQANSYCHL